MIRKARRWRAFLLLARPAARLQLICLLTAVYWIPSFGQAEAAADIIASKYEISIDTATLQPGQTLDTLDVVVSDGTPIGGFNFKIGVRPESMDIVDIVKGELPAGCGWEFFDSRLKGEIQLGDIIANCWTVVALPRLMPDSTDNKGPCKSLGRKASLAKIVVSINQTYHANDNAPLFFAWEDCGDNTISSIDGKLLNMSDSVYWSFPSPELPKTDELPTIMGSPEACISPHAIDRIKRTIYFTNGGVRFGQDN